MTKLRKQRRRKKFNYQRNRKRVRKAQEKTTKFNIKVDCQAMKESWDNRISAKENLDNMGIVMSATELMPIVSTKKSMVKKMKKMKNGSNDDVANKVQVTRPEVVEKLVQEANVERKQNFRFSSQQVKFITYMMDKHRDDYEAMSRDHKNHYQETPAKIRGMITKFISIPEHYAPYLKERGLLQTEENQDNDVVIDDLDQ